MSDLHFKFDGHRIDHAHQECNHWSANSDNEIVAIFLVITFIIMFFTSSFSSSFYGCSPCVLGNLWDVTATDIDKFCSSLCQQWLSEDGETQPTLASLLPRARGACTMQSLNGCAPVLYGLPVPLNRPKR